MTIIKHKRGSGVPSSNELESGELAIDTLAAKLYTKIGNAIVEIGGGSAAGGGVEEAPEDGVQYARQDAAWEPVSASGGSEWELLETVEVPVKTTAPWVTQVDVTGFTEDYRQYELLVCDVAPVSTTGQALSLITIGMNMTNGYDIYNPTTQCASWNSSVWMTTKHYTPNSNTSGQWHQLFGTDPNMQLTSRDGVNGVFKIRTGTLQLQSTDILPDFTTFEWSGSSGKTHFRSTGVANTLGVINTLSFNVSLDGYGLRSGVFKLFGLKRN